MSLNFTFYGHACFSIEIDGKQVLFDPFISPNELAKDINVSDISTDYVLVSHGHFDHVADVETICKNTNAKLVSNYEIVSWFQKKGLTNCHPMNHGGSWDFDFGKVKFVNAVHSSALPDDSYGGNAGGFIIESKDTTIYYTGDTAAHSDMQLFGDMHIIDTIILPIGDNFTMGADEAIYACKMTKCIKAVGVHFDTFPYIEINHDETIQKFKSAGIELLLPTINKTYKI